LQNVDTDVLSSQAESIPITGSGVDELDPNNYYVIYASTLTTGTPLSPPMGHDLGEKAHRFKHQNIQTDVLAKELNIQFVNDCGL
jgi:hypothetical protein